MLDSKYPLFSPELLIINYGIGHVIEDFRPTDPKNYISGPIGVAIDKKTKKIDPKNPYFSKAYQFAVTNDLDPGFFINKEQEEVKNKSKVRKR